jgi:hypothetical protein
MAMIQINNLNPTGSDLFSDDESYLKELLDSDLDVQGGGIVALSVLTSLIAITFCM